MPSAIGMIFKYDLKDCGKLCHAGTRVMITHYSALWQPSKLRPRRNFLRIQKRRPLSSWLAPEDIENLLVLSGFDVVS